MAVQRIPNDVVITGSLSAGSLALPTGAVSDASVASDAAIDAAKVRHAKVAGTDGGLGRAGTFVAKHVDVFIATGSCTIEKFQATLAGKNTTGTSGFDLNVNGSSALSAHATFTSADSNGDVKAGTISAANLVAGDVVSIEFTSDSGTPDGTGPFAMVEIDEAQAV